MNRKQRASEELAATMRQLSEMPTPKVRLTKPMPPTMTVRPMNEAPRHGGTILLLYRPQHYWAGKWHPTGTKWEQCRWVDIKEGPYEADQHWEPWEGSPKIHSTHHIEEEDCLGWMPVPPSEGVQS